MTPDLEIFRKVAERLPGMVIEDRTDLVATQRASKSKAEVAVMQHAVNITARGYEQVLATLRPGVTEFDIQETLEHAYRTGGSRGPAYGSIVGGGFNATVLHYHANDQPLKPGELVCIDSACSYQGYASDITRTYPVSGKFTKRQREIYDIVLKANVAAIAAVKAGVTFARIDAAARDIITKAGFGDFFIHGIGHHLGLETHDINPDAPLREGAVLTIEPGVYLPSENLGVRIEDDVLVTRSGATVLSSKIMKRADQIERAMSR